MNAKKIKVPIQENIYYFQNPFAHCVISLSEKAKTT